MAITNGKIERSITASSWSVAVTEVGGGGGPHTVSLTDGTYYPSTTSGALDPLGTAFAAALTANGSLSGTYAWSGSYGEGGTGKGVLSATGITSFAITWTSTNLRDALGFGSGPTISGSLSYTSTAASSAVWLATSPIVSPFGAGDNGWDEADASFAESPAGNVYAVYGQRKRACPFRWDAVTLARMRIANESVVNESFQKFFRDSILAEAGFAAGKVAGPLRIHWDADSTTVYVTCKLAAETLRKISQAQLTEGWTGLWGLDLGRVVEVPS